MSIREDLLYRRDSFMKYGSRFISLARAFGAAVCVVWQGAAPRTASAPAVLPPDDHRLQ
jgi:hypothetical protein